MRLSPHAIARCLLGVAVALTVARATAQSTGAERFAPQLSALVSSMYPELDAIYKDLHSHPELGFEEVRTAAKLAQAMRALGFEVTEKVGTTGLVALFRNGPGPTVMVRTELDALPMEERTGLTYASKVKAVSNGRETPVAHSCGHDLHMSSWVGAARALIAMKGQWQGTLMFVAQPAEEGGRGAAAMLADGLFTRFQKPDFAFALHTWAAPHGTVSYNVGAVTSNSDGFEITFLGRGGHGSAPDKTIDPIVIATRFVSDVQTVVSREKDPMGFGVITVGAFQAGTVGNIIPDTAVLRGTIRSYNPAVREKLLSGLRRTAAAAAAMSDAPPPQVVMARGGSAIINSEAVVSQTAAVLRAALGAQNVNLRSPITASEDFSEFVNQGVPSMFFFVGVSDPAQVAESKKPGGKPLPINHSPLFAPVPEPSIKTAVQAMSLAVLSALTPR